MISQADRDELVRIREEYEQHDRRCLELTEEARQVTQKYDSSADITELISLVPIGFLSYQLRRKLDGLKKAASLGAWRRDGKS